jgi:alkylhydroperoxidase family enzyme
MRRLAVSLFTLCALALAASAQPEKPTPPTPGPFPVPPDEDAWGKLPPRKNPPLPEWAKALAGAMPKTAAKMLELDYLHREKNPLGPVLAAKLRWVAADALGSKYGVATAEADLRAAGLTDAEFAELAKPVTLPPAERAALAFAKRLTEAGHTISDEQFAELLKHYGPEKVTAIVHTVAYANFHNRIVLGIGVKGESPVAAPVAAKFDTDATKVTAPDRPPWDDLKNAKGDGLSIRVEWGKDGFDELNRAMEKQKDRTFRMPLPDKSVYEKLPSREKESAQKILWNTVSAGYQPEMTRAWFACLYAFYEEAKVDRVFTNSVFWVVTRTNDCFY